MTVRKKLAALLCLVLVLPGGCRSSGEYYVEKEHAGQLDGQAGLSSNAIGNYYTLQTSLQNMIRSGRMSDKIRMSGYQGDLDEDLEEIREYFTTVYPLGVYAVQGIGYDKSRVLSETEISVTVQYRRTAEEIRSVVEIAGTAEFERYMTECFRGFEEHKVFSFNWFTDSDEQFMQRIMKSWMAAAEYAVGLRDISFTFYPEQGYRRIVEVEIKYLDDAQQLLRQVQEVRAAVLEAQPQMPQVTGERERLEEVGAWLAASVVLDEEATRVVRETEGLQKKTSVYTAYGAMVEGTAAQTGIVLAAEALCRQLGFQCQAVIGQMDGSVYWWLAVQTDEGWMHLDVLSQEMQMAAGQEQNVVPKRVFTHQEAESRFSWDEEVYDFS